MNKAIIALGLLAAMLAGIPGAAQEKREFSSYGEMRTYLGELFGQKKYTEAAALLESVLDRFPDNVLANTYNLAMARLFLGDLDKATQALEEGHRRGVFYGIWDFAAGPWDPVRSTPRFEAFLKENRSRVEQAQSKASMRIEVATPASYDPAKRYPLFIALHGGGESLADFKPLWTSPRLRGEFLTVYVQSSQVASMKGFHWQDIAVTRRDLEAAYKRALEGIPRGRRAGDHRRLFLRRLRLARRRFEELPAREGLRRPLPRGAHDDRRRGHPGRKGPRRAGHAPDDGGGQPGRAAAET